MSVIRRIAKSIGDRLAGGVVCALMSYCRLRERRGTPTTAKGGVSLQYMLGCAAACAIVSGTVLGFCGRSQPVGNGEALVSRHQSHGRLRFLSRSCRTTAGFAKWMRSTSRISIGLAAFLRPQ